MWTAVLTGGFPFCLMLLGAIRFSLRPPPRFVEVGVDGVLVGAQFIPYSEISGVDHARQPRTGRTAVQGGDFVEHTWHEWTVSIQRGSPNRVSLLFAGLTIEIVTQSPGKESMDPLGAEITRAINEALAAWAAGQDSEILDEEISRGERTGAQWLEALRGLGSGAATPYRSAVTDSEKLSRLLEDPRRKPSIRAAAAVALAASGDTTAAAKLRIAAGSMADRRVRVALESIADDTAVAEALEELDREESL